MRWSGLCYRAHDPKWAWSPLSGEGAALKGGRFNPIGQPTLYLAHSVEGMFLEMGHGFGHRFDPLTVCSYQVDVDDLIDLRTESDRAEADVPLADLSCAWAYDRDRGKTPASWTLARKCIRKGAAGILVPSFAVGARADMTNLVLWTWGNDAPHQVNVYDPDGRLPKDQNSWDLKTS